MNSGKTEFMYLRSRVQLSKCKETAVKVCENKVERSSHICLLGASLDELLSMKHHITLTCRAAMFDIHQIKYITPYLTLKACQTLFISLVMLHLNYTNLSSGVARM